jgi:hypothetical protein
MDIIQRVENDFRLIAPVCSSCKRKPFLVLFSHHGNGFVTCGSHECIERYARVEPGNNSDYGDAMGRSMRAWVPVSQPRP